MRPYTIFVDLDGILVKNNPEPTINPDVFLPNSIDRLKYWHDQGHRIVITTERTYDESLQTILKINAMLNDYLDVCYECTKGIRVLINDRNDKGRNKAFSINVERDKGLEGVVLE